MQEHLDLDAHTIRMAPSASAFVAVPRVRPGLQSALRLDQSSAKELHVLSGSGGHLGSVWWDEAKSGRIIDAGWSQNEDLVVVLVTGLVRRYMDFGTDFSEFTLTDQQVVLVRFLESGLVAELEDSLFVVVDDYDAPFPRVLVAPGSGVWTATSGEIYIAKDLDIIILDSEEHRACGFSDGPYTGVSVSPNGLFLSLYSERTNSVYIATKNARVLSQHTLEDGDKLGELCWCANDVVAGVVNQDEVRVFGPQLTLSFYYAAPVRVFTEFDGLWVLLEDRLEFLSKVSAATEDVFKIGSTSPALIILDSLELRLSQDPADNITALENVAVVRDALPRAFKGLVAAATEEFEPYWQRRLLKAASFARARIERADASLLVEAIQSLRVLNALRAPSVGMYMTYAQYKRRDLNILINSLLLKRGHHLVSMRVLEYLQLPLDWVYVDWCCGRIRAGREQSDDELFNSVVSRLLAVRDVSYERVSRVAFQEGRLGLAVRLINKEPISRKKIPLLVEMEEPEEAVAAAEAACNADAVDHVVAVLERKLPFSELLKVLSTLEKTLAAWEAQARAIGDRYLLKSFYLSFDRKKTLANIGVARGLEGLSTESDSTEDANAPHDVYAKFANKRRLLAAAARQYEELKSVDKDLAEDARLLKLEIKLVETQEGLQRLFPDLDFFGKLVVETVGMLILVNDYDTLGSSAVGKKISKILREFRVLEKRYYHLVIDRLSSKKKWSELYSFASLRRSPIGYEPFYTACVRHGALRQAGLYVDLMGASVDYGRKVQMYVRAGSYKSAAEEAFRNKDLVRLRQVREACGGEGGVASVIEEYIRELS